MGIEPTQDGTSALLTVLKTAEPTRTLPPPLWLAFVHSEKSIIFYTFFGLYGRVGRRDIPKTCS